MTKHYHSWLALGDSYTIGEGVPLHESFPYQTLQLLRKASIHFHAPEIIAKTGWTSFELAEQLLHTTLNEHYDFVTLLIGVNNQYRGLLTEDFATDFEFLLKKAIHLSGENPKQVIVLSIPDWGITPFAKERDTTQIAKEIDAYNMVCKSLAEKFNTWYVDITTTSRLVADDHSLLTADLLHYSAKAMRSWALEVADVMKQSIKS